MAKPGYSRRRSGDLKSGKRWRELCAATEPDSVRAWARRYLEALLVQAYSPDTVHARAQYLARFASWCEERDLATPGDVTRPALERFQRHLHAHCKANGKPTTAEWQAAFLAGVQGLFRWLVQNHYLAANPAADLVLPRQGAWHLPEPLSIEEIEQALARLDPGNAIELRDRAMWELLYSSGLRRAELLRLRVHDLDRARGTLFVHQGKGRKDRTVPIGERALAWVDKYLAEVRSEWLRDPKQDLLFLNPDGRPPTASMLTHRARDLLRRAGIAKPGACHLFRHTMATHLLEHGADVRYVQEMLGHTHLGTTQRYTHVSIGKLKAVHTAAHPAAKLKRASSAPGDKGEP